MVLSYLGEAVYLEAVVAVLVALVAVGGRAAGEDRGDGRFEGSLVDGRGSEAEAHGGDEGEQGGELHGVVGRCGQSEVQAETAWSTASKADGNANEDVQLVVERAWVEKLEVKRGTQEVAV
jgi:hypothetical protein